jgi:hypothetical protein
VLYCAAEILPARQIGQVGLVAAGGTMSEGMENLVQGPMLILLIVWGIVTAIFLVLVAWRSLLASHEDDQIFLDAAQEHMAREQRELVGKINSLSRPLMASGIVSGVLLLLIAGIFVYNGLKNF